MRILHLSNFSRERCGIANFGHQLTRALRNAGVVVDDWDITYSVLHAREERGLPSYLPDAISRYDIIHFNWHPVTSNIYLPGHFPWKKGTGPRVSVYLNDIPPWSGCPVHDRADVLLSAEVSPGCDVLPYPICDWIDDFPPTSDDFTVGWSGVRGDGAILTREACERLGYGMNPPGAVWTSYEDEIRRLARSTVNVCWYHEGRGISGGASQVSSARRPVILSNSSMFAHLKPYPREYYQDWQSGAGLDDLLREAHYDWYYGGMRKPEHALDDLSWSKAAARLVEIWEAARV